jgi:hypothetical protein
LALTTSEDGRATQPRRADARFTFGWADVLEHTNVVLVFSVLFLTQVVLPKGPEFAATYLGWLHTIHDIGLSAPFNAIRDQYGPNTYLALAIANELITYAGASPYLVFKLVQFSFVVLTYVTVVWITGSAPSALLLVLLLATNSILFSCAASYLGYCMLNTAVQINHIHAALVPLLFLAQISFGWRQQLVYWGLAMSVNFLLAFVWPFDRTLGELDVSLLFVVLNLAAFVMLLRAAVEAVGQNPPVSAGIVRS